MLLLSFLANLQVFLESRMAQAQFLALLRSAFAVWDLLGHTLHWVTNPCGTGEQPQSRSKGISPYKKRAK